MLAVAAAAGIEGHGQWCSVREDTLLPPILDSSSSATRMDGLAKQIDAQPRRNLTTRPASDWRARSPA
jgi:hypothetical protein